MLNESQESCDSYVKVCATEQNDKKPLWLVLWTVVSPFFPFSLGWPVSRL